MHGLNKMDITLNRGWMILCREVEEERELKNVNQAIFYVVYIPHLKINAYLCSVIKNKR